MRSTFSQSYLVFWALPSPPLHSFLLCHLFRIKRRHISLMKEHEQGQKWNEIFYFLSNLSALNEPWVSSSVFTHETLKAKLHQIVSNGCMCESTVWFQIFPYFEGEAPIQSKSFAKTQKPANAQLCLFFISISFTNRLSREKFDTVFRTADCFSVWGLDAQANKHPASGVFVQSLVEGFILMSEACVKQMFTEAKIGPISVTLRRIHHIWKRRRIALVAA